MAQKIWENIPYGIIVKDPKDDFRYTFSNEVFANFMNMTCEELIGKQDKDLIANPEALQIVMDLTHKAYETGLECSSYLELQLYNGSYYSTYFSLNRVRVAKDTDVLVAVMANVTRIRAIQAELQDTYDLLSTVSNALPLYFYAQENKPDGKVLVCNSLFSEAMRAGCQPNEIIGKTSKELADNNIVLPRLHKEFAADESKNLSVNSLGFLGHSIQSTLQDKNHSLRAVENILQLPNGQELFFRASLDVSKEQEDLNRQRSVNDAFSLMEKIVNPDDYLDAVVTLIMKNTDCLRVSILSVDSSDQKDFGITLRSEAFVGGLTSLDVHSRGCNRILMENKCLLEAQKSFIVDFNLLFHAQGKDSPISPLIKRELIAPITFDSKLWGVLVCSYGFENKKSDESISLTGTFFAHMVSESLKQHQYVMRLNQLDRLLNLVLDRIDFPIWLYDENAALLFSNAIGKRTCMDESLKESFSKKIVKQVVKTGRPVSKRLTFQGREYNVKASFIDSMDHSLKRVVKYALDVTELNKTNRELRVLVDREAALNQCFRSLLSDNLDDSINKVFHILDMYLGAEFSCAAVLANSEDCSSELECVGPYSDSEALDPEFWSLCVKYTRLLYSYWNCGLTEEQLAQEAPEVRLMAVNELPYALIPINEEESWLTIAPIAKGTSSHGCLLNRHAGPFLGYSPIQAGFFITVATVIGLALSRQKSITQIREAVQEAESANRMMSRFLATMSHEIRTPLNAVIGFTDLIQNGDDDLATTKQLVDYIALAAKTLQEQLNNILDLSKLEAGKMCFRYMPCDLRAICSEVMLMYQALMAEHNVKPILCITELPYLCLDSSRVKQILLNLVGNAVKFTQSGSITISAQYLDVSSTLPVPEADKLESEADKSGDAPEALPAYEQIAQPLSHGIKLAGAGTLLLKVTDTGVGISPEDQKRLFKDYVQSSVHSGTATGNKGTGLGLVICKRLTEQMDGNITIESEIGQGTSFIVTLRHVPYTVELKQSPTPLRQKKALETDESKLPLQESSFLASCRKEQKSKATDSEGAHARSWEHAGEGLDILLVDDDKQNLRILSAQLKTLGAQTTCCQWAQEAIELSKQHKFNSVLTDLGLHAMDGTELTRLLRAQEAYKDAPIACITSDPTNQFDLIATNLFDEVIIRPIEAEQLSRHIASLRAKLIEQGLL